MVLAAGFLSSFQSINFSIYLSSFVCLVKLTNWKRRLTFYSEGNPQRLTMELASLASLSFNMVRKRQLLGSCAEWDHWSSPGGSWNFMVTFENYYKYGSGDPLQFLVPYTDFETSPFSNLLQFLDGFYSSIDPWFFVLFNSTSSSEHSATSIDNSPLKLSINYVSGSH